MSYFSRVKAVDKSTIVNGIVLSQYNAMLRSSIFDALTRSNMTLFVSFGIIPKAINNLDFVQFHPEAGFPASG